MIRPLMASFKMTVRADCAVSTGSAPSIYKSSCLLSVSVCVCVCVCVRGAWNQLLDMSPPSILVATL